jgi:hypothetical protein
MPWPGRTQIVEHGDGARCADAIGRPDGSSDTAMAVAANSRAAQDLGFTIHGPRATVVPRRIGHRNARERRGDVHGWHPILVRLSRTRVCPQKMTKTLPIPMPPQRNTRQQDRPGGKTRLSASWSTCFRKLSVWRARRRHSDARHRNSDHSDRAGGSDRAPSGNPSRLTGVAIALRAPPSPPDPW